jgi:hypothetical protein
VEGGGADGSAARGVNAAQSEHRTFTAEHEEIAKTHEDPGLGKAW